MFLLILMFLSTLFLKTKLIIETALITHITQFYYRNLDWSTKSNNNKQD